MNANIVIMIISDSLTPIDIKICIQVDGLSMSANIKVTIILDSLIPLIILHSLNEVATRRSR
jgi:hypothetical protein